LISSPAGHAAPFFPTGNRPPNLLWFPIAVSVIIPAYNAAPWLPMLFDGLDAQSFRNFEVIFINDGSTDETANLLDSYAVERSNVKVIHQPNRGVAIARNTGLDAAVGKYVAFVDADDAIAPTYLEKLVSLADSLDLDIAFCSAWRFIRTPGDMTDANLLIHPKPQGVVPGKEWLERTVADKEWFGLPWSGQACFGAVLSKITIFASQRGH